MSLELIPKEALLRKPKAQIKFNKQSLKRFQFSYPSKNVGDSLIINADSFEWLPRIPDNSIHAIVTDPPYGVKEYYKDQLEKRDSGRGGIWRIPPAFDGNTRSPLPRFTALNASERQILKQFFFEWGKLVIRVLRPGAHIFIASNAFLSQLIFSSLEKSGLAFRGELIRIVRTLRGGDRPKNAEEEFSGVSSMARGCYEPWGIFRKPLPLKMKVSDCLREYQTGGLRRYEDENPFCDVISSERTPVLEKNISDHPSLKPQSFLRRVVRASLPLGLGIVLDPFMGSGSTIAAAEAQGISSIGVESNNKYFSLSCESIPKLTSLRVEMGNHRLTFPVF